MCTRQECLERLRNATPYIKKEFGVRSLCLFGSMARGDNRPDSDIDILVDMEPKIFVLVALKEYLQELLGTAVDLIHRHSNLSPFFINEIKRDGIYIFT